MLLRLPAFHNSAQAFQEYRRARKDRHKVSVTMTMQLGSAQPRNNVIHRFDVNGIAHK